MKNTYAAGSFCLITLISLFQPCPAPAIFASLGESVAGSVQMTAGDSALAAGLARGAASGVTGAATETAAEAAAIQAAGTDARAAIDFVDKIPKGTKGPDGTPSSAGPISGSGSIAQPPQVKARSLRERDGGLKSRDAANSTDMGACMMDAMNTRQLFDLTWADQGRVTISGLPPSCMTLVDSWNSLPMIAQLEQMQGKTTVLNGSAVRLDGVPVYTINAYKASMGMGQMRWIGVMG